MCVAHWGLGSVTSRNEGHPIDGRRSRRSVMPQMREGLLAWEVRRNHWWFDRAFVAMWWSSFHIIVVIVIAAAVEVTWAFVFVGTAMLHKFPPVSTNCNEVIGGRTWMVATNICVSCDKVSHIVRRVFV